MSSEGFIKSKGIIINSRKPTNFSAIQVLLRRLNPLQSLQKSRQNAHVHNIMHSQFHQSIIARLYNNNNNNNNNKLPCTPGQNFNLKPWHGSGSARLLYESSSNSATYSQTLL